MCVKVKKRFMQKKVSIKFILPFKNGHSFCGKQ